MDKGERIRNFLQTFDLLTKNAEDYVSGVNQVTNKSSETDIKNLLKGFYDFVKSNEVKTPRDNSLPELLIKNFDEEQIWQEIELLNNDYSSRFHSELTKLKNNEENITFSTRILKNEVEDEIIENHDTLTSVLGNSSEEDSENYANSKLFATDDESEASLEDSNQKKKKRKKEKKVREGQSKDSKKSSIVDDEFFKLSEMEQFLLAAEKNENADYNSEDSENEVDYFEDIPSDDEDGDEKKIKYNDFFADPRDGFTFSKKEDENDEMENDVNDECALDERNVLEGVDDDDDDDNDEEEEEIEYDKDGDAEKLGKRVRFATENSEDNSSNDDLKDDVLDNKFKESMETDSGSDSDSEKNSDLRKHKSTMEMREERLNKKIKELEDKALSDKPWQMKGEISAEGRPQNSLLEEVLEFDMTARPAPVMTEATTERLEDIIIRRIKDKAWDDVERKVKPVENISEFKKRLVLDQEKSKESLAEIYEKEFVKQREAASSVGLGAPEFKEPEEPREHKKITSMMVSLFSKLDALSNYHYTPLPAAPDVKIVNNLPAITMEEVAPVTATDAHLLAPEEVLGKKKRELMSKEERTISDRKRERRKKKKFQRVKKMRLEQKEKLNKDKPQKFTKAKAFENLKKLAKFKNVKVVS